MPMLLQIHMHLIVGIQISAFDWAAW